MDSMRTVACSTTARVLVTRNWWAYYAIQFDPLPKLGSYKYKYIQIKLFKITIHYSCNSNISESVTNQLALNWSFPLF